MDILATASAAAVALGGYLVRLASGAAGRAEDVVLEQLQQLVSERLRTTLTGTRVLDELTQHPADTARREAAALALADAAGQDAAFSQALYDAVSRLAPTVAVEASGPGTTVVSGGPFHQHGVIAGAGASVDQSRRTKISMGGWLAILAVLLVGYGATTAIVVTTVIPSVFSDVAPVAGEWTPKEQTSAAAFLRIDRDGSYRFEWLSIVGGQFSCEGTVAPMSAERTYRFTAKKGLCPSCTGVLSADGRTLLVRFDDDQKGHEWVRR